MYLIVESAFNVYDMLGFGANITEWSGESVAKLISDLFCLSESYLNPQVCNASATLLCIVLIVVWISVCATRSSAACYSAVQVHVRTRVTDTCAKRAVCHKLTILASTC